MNCGKEFEHLVKSIYEEMLLSEGHNLNVLHDIKLEGKSGQKHQIDLLWNYEAAGIKQQVLIECKNYSRNVSIGKIRDFFGVIDDIPGSVGVFICSSNYQKGAIEYAKAKGIQLFSIESLNKQEQCYTSLTTDFTFNYVSPPIIDPIVDTDWFKNKYPEATGGLFLHGDNVRVIDSNNRLIATSEDIVNMINREQPHGDYKDEIKFDDAYMQVIGSKYGLIKIFGVHISYSLSSTRSIEQFDFFAKYIVKNILNDKSHLSGKSVQKV
jgi:hypothetical protein